MYTGRWTDQQLFFNKQASTTLYSSLPYYIVDYTPLPFSQHYRYPEPDGIRHNLRITLLKDLPYLPTES
jgi:hypothetical protein